MKLNWRRQRSISNNRKGFRDQIIICIPLAPLCGQSEENTAAKAIMTTEPGIFYSYNFKTGKRHLLIENGVPIIEAQFRGSEIESTYVICGP